jgi:hypothetical protein
VLCVVSLHAADLFRGAHLLSVRHAVCAEHGELIHAHGVSAGGARQGSDHAEVAPPAGAGHEHEHCGVSTPGSKAGVATVMQPAPLVGEGSFTAIVGLTEMRPADGRAVLAYAPKQSPPVLA